MWSPLADAGPSSALVPQLDTSPGHGPSARTGAALPGDVLIRTRTDDGHHSCTLSAVPGPDQVCFPTLTEASRAGRDYASQRRVDVWSDDGAGHVTRLAHFRPSVTPMALDGAASRTRRPAV